MTNPDSARLIPRWRDPLVLRSAAYGIVVLAASWWLLGQLAAVLRPLLTAALLSYVLLPYYAALRRRGVPTVVAIGLLAGLAAGVIAGVALAVYGSLLGLSDELPRLKQRAVELAREGFDFVGRNVPWVVPNRGTDKRPEEYLADGAADMARSAVNVAAAGMLEAATAGLYLLFLLLGAERLPGRVRVAYAKADADRILGIAGHINSAIVSYLKAKVQASLILAVPVGLVLATCDVRFSLLWAVLTFLCNFIPYAGSVVAYTVPVVFAFLQMGFGPWPLGVALALLAIHVATATLVEPTLIGKAVGLSPLVILGALAVWGALWGLPGMFLAVPLTVVMKLVMENFELTRPVAKLAED